MPKASKASSTSPARLDQAPVDLARYLETLVAPITELQGRLEALPSIAPQLHAHVATSEELSVKTQRINELEAAVAAFDSVHMRTSEALRIEIGNLTKRLEHEGKHVGSLKNDHDKSLEKIKLQHKQALEKLELNHSSTVESLEKKYQDQLRDERNELDKVKREMEDVDVKNCGLREKLDLANEKLRLLEGNMAYLPEDNFEEKWKDLAKVFHLFCKEQFTNIPETPTNHKLTAKESSYLVNFVTALPFPLPTSDTQASALLHLALVQHHISSTLCKNIFRTIVVPSTHPDASTIFESISTVLYRKNPHLESTWRSLTTTALSHTGPKGSLNVKVQDMATEIIDLTYLLIPVGNHDSVHEKLCGLFKIAFTTWRPTQRCSARIFATTDLGDDNHAEQWGSQLEQDEFGCASDMDDTEQQCNSKVLCLFPRVYREDQDGGRHVYFPGTALYADSGAYVAGLKEHRVIQNLREEMAKKKQAESGGSAVHGSRRSRRLSMSRPLPQPLPTQVLVHKPRIIGTGKALEAAGQHQQVVRVGAAGRSAESIGDQPIETEGSGAILEPSC